MLSRHTIFEVQSAELNKNENEMLLLVRMLLINTELLLISGKIK
jgi:hypothetical protein